MRFPSADHVPSPAASKNSVSGVRPVPSRFTRSRRYWGLLGTPIAVAITSCEPSGDHAALYDISSGVSLTGVPLGSGATQIAWPPAKLSNARWVPSGDATAFCPPMDESTFRSPVPSDATTHKSQEIGRAHV